MLFSIVIPVYNSKDFIRNCLDSILAQPFHDFEVVIIDDGSTDGTDKILDDYAKNNDKLKVYHFENAGVSASRQRGVSASNGDYVLFVDSDDSVNPHLLEQVYESITTYNEPDIVRYQVRLINDSSYKDHNRHNFFDTEKTVLNGISALKAWSIPGKKYAMYWLFAFKKTLFSNILHFPNLRCYEDVALIPLLIAQSEKVVTIDYVGYNYTCNHSESLTNIISQEAIESRARDFVKAYHYAINNFKDIKTISAQDLDFFQKDYDRRLKGMYDSLTPELKEKLSNLFGF